MKKIALIMMMAFMSLTILPFQSFGSATKAPSELIVPTPAESSEAKTLLLRLNEINSMEKSNLSSSEKKALKKEVKSANKKLRSIGGGVYLSAGAVLVILILLVILT